MDKTSHDIFSDLLVTDKHNNQARQLLGKTYRFPFESTNPGASLGGVEVNNAVREVAYLLAKVEYLQGLVSPSLKP